MPFLSNIFTRNPDREGKSSPRWSRSLGSPKSPKSFESSESPKSPRSSRGPGSPRSLKPPKPLTSTERNTEYLNQCLGCNNVADLIGWNTGQQRNGEARVTSTLLHNSFAELERCAHRCEICRVFRQSLLLEEVTYEGVRKLQKDTKESVIVHWNDTTDVEGKSDAHLTVEVKDRPRCAGVVNCNSKSDVAHLALHSDPGNTVVIDQAREWLNVCLNNHTGDCDNLRFSRETPQLLIEIFSPDLIRLCEKQAVDYVALSYCWGVKSEEVKKGMTVHKNIDRRRQGFGTDELPATVRDALQIVHAMGVRYAWVDSLCINQDTGIGVETMHKVYSNALFTICACASSGATGNLLSQREAWTLQTEPCRLGGQWLTTSDMSLNELRLRSPLADRAWTLQEERLSPRMLYISSNRMYWSCAMASEIELKPTYERKRAKLQRPVYTVSDRDAETPRAQEFLMACYDRKRDLHPFWADVVKSYALRDMSDNNDRLNALSGLAVKYLSANSPDEYLVGIWAKNLPEGLAWKVQSAVGIDRAQGDAKAVVWPSWSWAVLPLKTALDTAAKNSRTTFFQRLVENGTVDPGVVVNAEKAVKVGVDVKELRVRGRLRSLWKPMSRWIDWSYVSKIVDGQEKFTFAIHPEQKMHAIDVELGRVLVYEDRQKEVVGQLDFRRDVSRLQAEHLHLMALEIGETTMLLLERCGKGVYRRVGVAWNVRNNYFALAKQEDLILR
ncbi:heterokaryon incompatibility protein-domain-containing protein [Boeremia exigua]|uniref:heterokaryon incompatibility protein-domain-containing protein n=1 Tax=Boeremia exigua TaxID=749465 RepID=UPI001E8EEA3F|nr:heterokaryon incompatibility protein-domain-containing protein [Boeremia exigua]KAH6625115.1 heterokaryon incompatibility protein-domain-containing protein [Boeremia exigua]